MLSMISHYIYPLVNQTLQANYEKNLDNNALNTSIIESNFLYFYLWKFWLIITGNKRLAYSYQQSRSKSRMAMDQVLLKRISNQSKMVDQWKQLKIDAVLVPCSPLPALKIENFKHFTVNSGGVFEYTSLFGSLYWPQGIVPVTTVKESETTSYDDEYNDAWTKIIREDIKGSAGLPVSVSVVGRPQEDELVLGVMQAIENKIKFNKMPPLK
ncbi:amidase family protein [Stylonychia lemnae]|uniref:Amidase family protein n=1 Tax=Stylonychia lemnae TaxID=5949 RepID=A0A078AN00_STYLE|nr:amidase family protein [Stylonychia lemnae]|eukprot:CDW83534.1 amidase family protein [Stylonychia lemnae]